MVNMDNITSIFREKKLKLTPQRIAVYKYLKSTKDHPSAELIYKSLQPLYPTMSLATVYKALKTLVEVNLIQELNVGEGNFRYDGTVTSHPHVQCSICGKVVDVEGISFDDLNMKIQAATNFQISSNQLYFYGTCPDCNTKH